jgi:hypothetical protein
MKRIIKDYDTMSEELKALVGRTFPDGIQRGDLLTFPTATGKRFSGVEIHTEDAIYIIKGSFTQAIEKKGFFVVDDDEEDLDDFMEDLPPDVVFKEEEE